MKPVSAQWNLLLARSHRIVTTVDAYYNNTLTLPSVPILAGQVSYDATGHIQRTLELTVPVSTPTLGRLDPATDPYAPLAAYGQRLHVQTGIDTPDGPEVKDQGWYVITGWRRDEATGTLEISGEDLSRLIADNDFHTQSPGRAMFSNEFRRLAAPLPVRISGLTNRPVPNTVMWPTDKIQALQLLCDMWPARWHVDDEGYAAAAPPYPLVTPGTTPDLILLDGIEGTIVDRGRQADRGAIYNSVSVTGKTPDDGGLPPFAIAEILDPASPIRVNGPYGRNVRPPYQSDLILTQTQAQEAAQALLDRYQARGRAEQVTCIPNPAIELGDVALLYTADGDVHTGRVTAIELPLTAAQGAMSLTVSTVAGEENRATTTKEIV